MNHAITRFKHRFARIDTAFLLTLALCAFSLWPLLYRPGLPNGNDVLYHTFRVAEMSRSWQHGVLFPRWAEAFYTGYGAPVFHYYASLSYYVTVVLMRLFNVDALNALRVLIALAMLSSGAGMYRFARHFSGKLGGVIAALAYVYSPYILFTEPYSRGAYPEMAAFALFPLVMALYARLQHTGGAGAFVAAAISSAALIITHNLMALVLTGLLVGWLVWSLLVRWLKRGRADVLSQLLALVAAASGIGLAAYFWLPVVLEGGEAHLNNLTGLAGVAELDYRRFFVPLNHLLAFSPRYDEGAANGLFHRFNLGVAQWALAIMGVISTIFALSVRRRLKPFGYLQRTVSPLKGLALRRLLKPLQWAWSSGSQTALASGDARHHALFFALAALAFIFLMLPEAGNVWGAARVLAFLQFPWRFLGPAAFCLAFLAGMNARWIERMPKAASAALTAAIVVAIIGLAMPALYAPEWTNTVVDTSVAAYHQEELMGRQRATTFSNEYLPAAVKVEPGATPRLLADYADGYPVNKAHLEALPEGVTVEVLEHGPQHDVWQVQTSAPFTLEVLTFDFAGWTATIDDQPVPITPSDPHGLITFPVPAGQHIVRLWLGSTPARDLGNVVSLGTLVEVAAMSILLLRQSRRGGSQTLSYNLTLQPATRMGLVLGGILSLALFAAFMRAGGAWLDSPPGTALAAQHPTDFHLGDTIQLLGYDLNGDSFRPGDRLELSVYWYTSGPIPYGYSSFVHITNGGPPVAQADKLNPADRPTKTWTSEGYIRDDYTIILPNDMPPGTYQLFVGLYTCDTRPAGDCGNGDRLPVTDAAGASIGDAVLLALVEVR